MSIPTCDRQYIISILVKTGKAVHNSDIINDDDWSQPVSRVSIKSRAALPEGIY